MNKRRLWTTAFLGLTGLVIGLEIWAATDTSPDTIPWTDYIVEYVSGEIVAGALGFLTAWLAIHFARRYWRKPPTSKE